MKLNPGDKVGIISPSSFLRNREAVELGLDYLRSLKLEPVLGEHVFDAFRYMAGTPEDRTADLHRPGNKSRFLHCRRFRQPVHAAPDRL